MRRRPPRLKRTDTLLPYTTLVRSGEPQMTMPTNLRRNASAIALGLALTAWLPAAAMEQDADTAPVEAAPAEGEIIVTGIRGAINNTVLPKKANTTIAEVISTEDIAKRPDLSIAESPSRPPGIATHRTDGDRPRAGWGTKG